jgi:pyruvate formate lyase activating enzyme
MAQVSLSTGGCIKVDVKAWNEYLHRALCGISNRRTLENLALLVAHGEKRSDPPLLVASTLLVPGYVDVEEVGRIARFIASLNPHIPYALLAFHPSFFLSDLPPTSRSHAFMAKEQAQREGLSNVRIGNVHLLGKDY